MRRSIWLCLGLCPGLLGCDSLPAEQVGGAPQPRAAEADPLDVSGAAAAPGTLDELHEKVLSRSCAGQPGLCHAGQFEPNLSTPALAYANLVYRPSLEKAAERRHLVVPGDPAGSVLVMKLRGAGVATRMPLGAPPLAEGEMALLEAWIRGGALRRPGQRPAPRLNNPPAAPEVGLYNDRGERLGEAGPVSVAVGQTLVLRHSARDFETPEADIPFSLFTLTTDDGRSVHLTADPMLPHLGYSSYDPATTPPGTQLSFRLRWTVPATLRLLDQQGQTHEEPAGGQRLNLLALYVDSQPLDQGMTAFSYRAAYVQVK